MQDYSYSVFSLVAIAIHIITNFDLLVGRRARSAHAAHYNDFAYRKQSCECRVFFRHNRARRSA